MKAIDHRFLPAAQSMWTERRGSTIRRGQSGKGVGLFEPELLREFDRDMEEGLKQLGSDFPYDGYYELNANG